MKRGSRLVLLIALIALVGIVLVRAVPRRTSSSVANADGRTMARSSASASDRESISVREPAVAGTFYPAKPDILQRDVRAYMEQASQTNTNDELVALIVPHAGYPYSGSVAGYAYKALQADSYETVAIVGPSHHARFDGVGLSSADRWKTPLGDVKIDRAASNDFAQSCRNARFLDQVHAPEHSIEVQLPFLQESLDHFRLLPILVSDFSAGNCSSTAKALVDLYENRRLLLIASTDMSHYPAYDDAIRVDREMLRAIETLDPTEVANTSRRLLREGVPGLATCLCGEGPVEAILMACRILGADTARVLKYANSGDAPHGSRDRVVGYGAVAIYRSQSKTDSSQADRLSPDQQHRLLTIARAAVEQYLRDGKASHIEESDPALLAPRAVFVTLKQRGRLRGCIGTTRPVQPLVEAVRDRAIMAATQDPRFAPLTLSELGDLDIEISVLSPLSQVTSPDEIDLSKHGVVVVRGSCSGLYLPQVAQETGWSRDQLLSHLCQEKAGLPPDAWREDAKLYVFTVQAFHSPAPGGESHANE